MEFTERESKVLEFVTKAHQTQTRKYTGEPYVNHLVNVARMVKEHGGTEIMVCAALCHDIIEDNEHTDFYPSTLIAALRGCRFDAADITSIVDLVSHLTDKYTSNMYSRLNRRDRKYLEARRLGETPPEAQTIKYADLIDNTSSIVRYDPCFAKTYLAEKKEIIERMGKGNLKLYQKVCDTYTNASSKLMQLQVDEDYARRIKARNENKQIEPCKK